MQIFYIEADAEEMKANRTILETISTFLNNITDKIAGCSVQQSIMESALLKAIDNQQAEEDKTEEDEVDTEVI